MAVWHLQELRNAFEQKGWRVIAEHPGDDYRVSATWEIQRSTEEPSIFIDFEGLDDLVTLPLEQSYGCQIRGKDSSRGLYFGRKGEGNSARQENWRQALREFISELEKSRVLN